MSPERRNLYLPHEKTPAVLRDHRFAFTAHHGPCQEWESCRNGTRLTLSYRNGTLFHSKTLHTILETAAIPVQDIRQHALYLSGAEAEELEAKREHERFGRRAQRADPFTIDGQLRAIAESLTVDIPVERRAVSAIAHRIFEWVINTVHYGDATWKAYNVGYRTALETFEGREGVCGEMTYLCMAMCRHVGLECYYVTSQPKWEAHTNHGFMGLVEEDRVVLCDPATQYQDADYPYPIVRSDEEVIYRFNLYRSTIRSAMPKKPKPPSEYIQELTERIQNHDVMSAKRGSMGKRLTRHFWEWNYREELKRKRGVT